MRRACVVLVLVMIGGLIPGAAFAQDPGWPRKLTNQGNTLVYYQPQVNDWQDFTNLRWRMAFSLTPAGGKAVLGVVEMEGTTSVDSDNKWVSINNTKILNTYFPSLNPANKPQMDQLLRTFMSQTIVMSLNQLVASVPKTSSAPGVPLRNDPPTIFVSYRPAILLDVEGEPVLVPIEHTKLEYVINTHWGLFFDKSKSEYFLLVGQQWMSANQLTGPWSVVDKLPKEMEKLPKETEWADLKKYIPPPPPGPNAVTPTVLYSTVPAQVILFNGPPVYAQVQGTGLTYATNTLSYVFVYALTNQYYYLTAGRWFIAGDLAGPWTFATPSLPADFTRIPPTSPAAQVLASVPGTEEARDAVLLAQIPTTAVVNRTTAAANAKTTYDGSPQFAPIQGTTLSYATNTPDKVIQVGDLYYLCQNGIWFTSAFAQGPWQTASSVPQVIYTIPPSSPVYNVTYVTQVTTSSGDVQASYTAGYLGAFVMGAAIGAVIAGGTGYYYPPYVGVYAGYGYPHYYATPYTYGAGSYYNCRTGAYGVSQTAYGPYGSATRTASYNPYTGTYARTASASTAYGHASVGQAYNPYTGAYGATKQGSNAYSQWGSSVVSRGNQSAYAQHYTTSQGTVGSVQGSGGGRAVGTSTAYGNSAAAKSSNGDLYAGHNGNVYKNTGTGWQQYNNGSWNDVNKPSSTSADHPEGGSDDMQGLQNDAQDRQRSTQETQRSQDFQKSSGGWGGGSGWGNSRWGGGGGSHSWGGGGGWGGGGRSFGGGGRRW